MHGANWIVLAFALLSPAPKFASSSALQVEIDAAQGGIPTAGCKECGATGKTPCPKHPKAECAFEDGVEFCSVIAACEMCGGTGFVLCKHCGGTPETREALAKKRELVIKRKGELANIDETMGRPVRKAESTHFVMCWEIEALKVDKTDLNGHALMHFYLKTLEQENADYRALLAADEKEFAEKCRVYVWFLQNDQMRASTAFCEQGSKFGMKLLGSHPRYSVCGNKQFFVGEPQLRRNLIHNVAHLLLSHQKPAEWVGNLKAGWADEGLAHWFEYKSFQRCDTYCYQEQNTNSDFKGGDYKVVARKMVAADKYPSWAVLFDRNSDSLKTDEHVIAFSYVDYLLQKDATKFNELCRDLRRKMSSRDALKKEFNLSPIDFENEWKAWVLATYPVAKD